ncbi:unnamed protein product [Caenorhabditis bovis]|uniref:Major facilitator superfamily (MFS) profile domain-containing protein n=1 Tax=Caenorhabditis bovis TaxID=2654633 RepID=A0A8S1ED96_9PELO|nr:unnamed protein product [Caenorhabditis bovis]
MNDVEGFIHETDKRSILFSAPSIGSLVGIIPSVHLISKFGVRYVLTVCGICSSIGTFFFPFSIDVGFGAAVICRVLQGLGTSVLFMVVGVVPVHWAANNEMGTFLAILSCSYQLSNVICMPVSGLLCESSFGWRSTYYIFGAFTMVFYCLFFLFYLDSPKSHRNVSTAELQHIEYNKTIPERETVPYLKICKDPTVLAAWLCEVGGNTGFYILVLYGPTYINKVLHFDVRGTGFATALPFLIAVVVKFITGPISDRSTCVSEKARCCIFTLLSQFGLAAGFCVMSLTSNQAIAQIAYTFSIAASSINIVGVLKCCQLRARQHVHFVVAMISVNAAIVRFVAPVFVGTLCPDNSSEQVRNLE